MDFTGFALSLVSGILGGNVAGAAMHDKSLGPLGNSTAGLLGGGIGSLILHAIGVLSGSGAAGDGVDLGSVIGNVSGGGVGGALALLVVALIKGDTAKV